MGERVRVRGVIASDLCAKQSHVPICHSRASGNPVLIVTIVAAPFRVRVNSIFRMSSSMPILLLMVYRESLQYYDLLRNPSLRAHCTDYVYT